MTIIMQNFLPGIIGRNPNRDIGPVYLLFQIFSKCRIDRIDRIEWFFSKCQIGRIDRIDPLDLLDLLDPIDPIDPIDPTLRKFSFDLFEPYLKKR